MSQHWLKTTHAGKPVEVMLGWDRQLQGFFMCVFNTDEGAGDEEEVFLYNNLDSPESHPKTLDPFLKALDELKIKVPLAMIEEVKMDKVLNMGNRVQSWDEAGNRIERPR